MDWINPVLLSFHSTSSSTLVDSLINMHKCAKRPWTGNYILKPALFTLFFWTLILFHSFMCYWKCLLLQIIVCWPQEMFWKSQRSVSYGLFSCLHRSIRFPSNESAAVGLLQVSVLSIFLWDSINLSLMLRLISVISKSPIECNWVDPGHSSDFQLMYRIICYR